MGAGTAANAYKDVTAATPDAAAEPVPMDARGRFSVQGAWDNHFGAFGNQDVTAIMQDYVEQSVLKAFDHSTGTLTTATFIFDADTKIVRQNIAFASAGYKAASVQAA